MTALGQKREWAYTEVDRLHHCWIQNSRDDNSSDRTVDDERSVV